MKKILFVTPEATPFAASGGLGDVMGALPRAIRRLLGSEGEVKVMLPLYTSVPAVYRRRMRLVFRGELSLAWRRIPFAVHRLVYYGVEYLFIEHAHYFSRASLYGEFDDGERFAFFGRAVLEYIKGTGDIPDVLHANDWQSAMSVIYPRTVYAADPDVFRIATVYTVHNMEYQGRYDTAILSDIFDLHPVHLGAVEYDGCLNLMKGAITLADRVTTVSPRYAEELKEPEHSFGLFPVIRDAAWKMTGILNGLDTAFFSPRDREVLAFPYGAENADEGKRKNKEALREELGLASGDGPLFAVISRLTGAKGVDLLLSTLDRLLAKDCQLVLLGTGERHYEEALASLLSRYPDRARAVLSFDRRLSKRLYAAADILLMPSRSEPCGLAQMTACRYGCVPVVHAVGGLRDSIKPYGMPGGNGFVFYEANEDAFLSAAFEALSLYRDDPSEWSVLRRACMRTDFTWRRSAEKYLELYQKVTYGRGYER